MTKRLAIVLMPLRFVQDGHRIVQQSENTSRLVFRQRSGDGMVVVAAMAVKIEGKFVMKGRVVVIGGVVCCCRCCRGCSVSVVAMVVGVVATSCVSKFSVTGSHRFQHHPT